MSHLDERKPLHPAVRKERKWRGCFRCEWCGRWTQVPIEEYWKRLHIGVKSKGREKEIMLALNKKHVHFYCKREGCVQSRTM